MIFPDVWNCDYARAPFGRYGGALASQRPDDPAAAVIRAVMARQPGLDPDRVDEVILGCANQAGEDNCNVARMSALLSDLPVTVPGTTINRLCASGLDAVGTAVRAIRAGELDVVLAGSVESMSRALFILPKAESAFARAAQIEDTTIGWRFVNPKMQELDGADSMPETAENVADAFGVSRHDQDCLALCSQEWAAAGQDWQRLEIVPSATPQRRGPDVLVSADEHPRPNTTHDMLSRLRPIVRKDGTVTAGNASGVNDGAAVLLLAFDRAVAEFDLTPMARVQGMATAGIAPRRMGIGPVSATQQLCERMNLSITDFDLIELNEAFAAQVLAVLRQLGVADDAKFVNQHGGAIALAHPLGPIHWARVGQGWPVRFRGRSRSPSVH